MEIRVTVEGIEAALRRLDRLVGEEALRAGLSQAAFFVEGQAKVKAPIDFGFLANSIYSVTALGSGYGAAAAAATARNPNGVMLPEEKIRSNLEAVIGVGAEYGVYVEMGTGRMEAQPFMRPALENNRERIAGMIRDALARRAGQ